jgi:hypothetical protein
MNVYVCGDGRRFPTFELASEHANRVFKRKGIIVAIETKPARRHGSPFAKREPGFARRAERHFKQRDRAAALA